ncbi:hypothetical protein GW750_00230 [bacterium]|nr:hypothetical protein [bacterium]
MSDCPTKITQEKALSLDTKIFIYSSTNHICEYIPPNNDDRFYTITLRDKLKEDNCQFLPKLKIDVEAKKFLYKDRNLNLKSYSEEEVLEF